MDTRKENTRKEKLKEWLHSFINTPYEITPASVDASYRRYFRVSYKQGTSHIAVDAPPDKEKNQEWLRVQMDLCAQGVVVPEVICYNLHCGFFLLSDLGNESYLAGYQKGKYEQLVPSAVATLLRFQSGIDATEYPAFSEDLYRAELDLYHDWYLGKHHKITLSSAQQASWQKIKTALIASNCSQPQVFVHRDYHSRNVMVMSGDEPGILDFQDAVRGPLTYDLMSLLRDCYWRCDGAYEDTILREVFDVWRRNFSLTETDDTFRKWYDYSSVQRHLKVAGIFCRLNYRDGKSRYLHDIPLVMEYLKDSVEKYEELHALQDFMPLVK